MKNTLTDYACALALGNVSEPTVVAKIEEYASIGFDSIKLKSIVDEERYKELGMREIEKQERMEKWLEYSRESGDYLDRCYEMKGKRKRGDGSVL